MFPKSNLTLIVLAAVLLHPCRASAEGRLILYYDFEGDTTVIEDVSGFTDVSGTPAPANGTLIDLDGTPNNASVITDTVDPTGRGNVLKAADTGYGAQIPHARKMDFRNSYTLQAWVRTGDPNAAWQLAAGFGPEAQSSTTGPRVFAPHWGVGGNGAGRLTNELLHSFGLDAGFEPVQICDPDTVVGSECVDQPSNNDPPIPVADENEWHHVLVTWNAETQEIWGWWDAFDGQGLTSNGFTTRGSTQGDTLVAQPNTPFFIADPQDGPLQAPFDGNNPHPDFWVDDVAFWHGFAPPDVVAGLANGTISVHDAAAMLELPTATADFDGDSDVDGNDFLTFQQNSGLDDIDTFAVTVADGDGNGDLKVDRLDLELWETEFATLIAPQAAPATVPEPASYLLTFGAIAVLSAGRRFALSTWR